MKKVLSLICVFSICLLLGFTTEPKSVSAAGDPNLHQLILTNNDCYKVAIIIWQCVFLFLIFVGLQTLVSLM